MSKLIKQQWQQMVERGTVPLFEIQIAESEWLIVDLELHPDGIKFSFDTSPLAPYNPLPVSFDTVIKTLHEGVYVIHFNDGVYKFESLDEMLKVINDNITEGFLLPNNLFYSEDC